MVDNIRVSKSGIHGYGGFATRPFRTGARVVEYLGERITKEESFKRCQAQNWFIFGLDEEYDLDGNVTWNPARFINHSCQPNCEAVCDEGHVWIVALRDIRPGEEVTFNYGYDLIDIDEHRCRCGASGCVGYMVAEEFFEQARKRQAEERTKNS